MDNKNCNEINAIQWTFHIESVRTSIDRVFHLCQEKLHVLGCREMLFYLTNSIKDFQALIKMIELEKNFDNNSRPTSLAWELRGTGTRLNNKVENENKDKKENEDWHVVERKKKLKSILNPKCVMDIPQTKKSMAKIAHTKQMQWEEHKKFLEEKCINRKKLEKKNSLKKKKENVDEEEYMDDEWKALTEEEESLVQEEESLKKEIEDEEFSSNHDDEYELIGFKNCVDKWSNETQKFAEESWAQIVEKNVNFGYRKVGEVLKKFEKYSSPLRKKPNDYEERLARAEEVRIQILEEKCKRIRQLFDRVASIREKRLEVIEKKRSHLEKKMLKAEQNRKKIYEDAILKNWEEENYLRSMIFERAAETALKDIQLKKEAQILQERLKCMEEERLKKYEEKAAKEAAAKERKKQNEDEKKAKLALKIAKMESIVEQKKAKEKEKCAEIQKRNLERNKKKDLKEEVYNTERGELLEKIIEKQKSSTIRYEKGLDQVRKKANELSAFKNTDSFILLSQFSYLPSNTDYLDKNKKCTLCDIILTSDLFVLAHVVDEGHLGKAKIEYESLSEGLIKEYLENIIINIDKESPRKQKYVIKSDVKKREIKLKKKIMIKGKENENILQNKLGWNDSTDKQSRHIKYINNIKKIEKDLIKYEFGNCRKLSNSEIITIQKSLFYVDKSDEEDKSLLKDLMKYSNINSYLMLYMHFIYMKDNRIEKLSLRLLQIMLKLADQCDEFNYMIFYGIYYVNMIDGILHLINNLSKEFLEAQLRLLSIVIEKSKNFNVENIDIGSYEEKLQGYIEYMNVTGFFNILTEKIDKEFLIYVFSYNLKLLNEIQTTRSFDSNCLREFMELTLFETLVDVCLEYITNNTTSNNNEMKLLLKTFVAFFISYNNHSTATIFKKIIRKRSDLVVKISFLFSKALQFLIKSPDTTNLFVKLIYAIGFFSKISQKTKTICSLGWTQSIAYQLTILPFEYFMKWKNRIYLMSTLISISFQSPNAISVIKTEIDIQWFVNFLNDAKNCTEESEISVITALLPHQLWDKILLYFKEI